jgi:transcriptional regulator with XRE-family HTH domain
MPTLGQELREERERRSISLKDISNQTKIGTRILSALESDRWDLMPQKFFIRGVIKAYAQTIGVDPGIYLAKYDEQRQVSPESQIKEHEGDSRRARQMPAEDMFESAERSRNPGLTIFIIVAALLLISAAVYFFLIRPASPGTEPPPAASVAAPAETEAGTETAAPEEQRTAVVESGLRLEFRFIDETWMYVTADGEVVMNGNKTAGTTVELRAEREFVLLTGNAGGFEYSLNGRPGRPLGGPGVVLRDVRINLENAASFLKEEKPPSANGDDR